MGKGAVPALTTALKDKDTEVRRAVVRALAEMGQHAKAAVPALAGVLKDADSGLRVAAAMALGDIGPDARTAVPELIVALKDREVDVRRRVNSFGLQCDSRKRTALE